MINFLVKYFMQKIKHAHLAIIENIANFIDYTDLDHELASLATKAKCKQ